MKTAWVITWEWCGDHAHKENKLVDIFHPNTSENKIRSIVERIYVDSEFTLSEKVEYIKNNRKTSYPAIFDKIEGVNWRGRIFCGHNPYLYTRKVKNLQIKVDSRGNEYFDLEDTPKPEIKFSQ